MNDLSSPVGYRCAEASGATLLSRLQREASSGVPGCMAGTSRGCIPASKVMGGVAERSYSRVRGQAAEKPLESQTVTPSEPPMPEGQGQSNPRIERLRMGTGGPRAVSIHVEGQNVWYMIFLSNEVAKYILNEADMLFAFSANV